MEYFFLEGIVEASEHSKEVLRFESMNEWLQSKWSKVCDCKV